MIVLAPKDALSKKVNSSKCKFAFIDINTRHYNQNPAKH